MGTVYLHLTAGVANTIQTYETALSLVLGTPTTVKLVVATAANGGVSTAVAGAANAVATFRRKHK